MTGMGLVLRWLAMTAWAVVALGGVAPPSIILYLADDLGYGEVCQQDPTLAFPVNPLGPHGGNPIPRPANPLRTLNTPNLARLARQGVRSMFSYSPSATCTPSRGGILVSRNTGTIPMRDNMRVAGLDLDLLDLSFPSVLRDQAGYHTALIGKWGLGSNQGAPWNHGFDLFFGQLETVQAWSWFPYSVNYFQRPWFSNAVPNSLVNTLYPLANNTVPGLVLSEQECTNTPWCTATNDVFRQVALQFVANHSAANAPPFFLMWCTTAPHIGTYIPGQPNNFLTSPTKRMGSRGGTMDLCKAGHGAQVEEHLDSDIGALLDLLEYSPRLNSTLVVFTSDNGPPKNCPMGNVNLLKVFLAPGGLKGSKTTLWEAGVRMPTIVRWPGHIAPNSVLYSPHTMYNLGVTFIDIAGIAQSPLPTVGPQGGLGGAVSMKPLWTQGDDAFVQHWAHLELCPGDNEASCMTATYNFTLWRLGVIYKLLVLPGRGGTFLMNIAKDPGEEFNLIATAEPAVLNGLLNLRNEARVPMCPPPQAFTACPLLNSTACAAQSQQCIWCPSSGLCAPGFKNQVCKQGVAFYAKCAMSSP